MTNELTAEERLNIVEQALNEGAPAAVAAARADYQMQALYKACIRYGREDLRRQLWQVRDKRTTEERLEDLEWLLDTGCGEAEILKRSGFPSTEAMKKAAWSAGRKDLADRVTDLGGGKNTEPLGIPTRIKSKHYDNNTKRRKYA